MLLLNDRAFGIVFQKLRIGDTQEQRAFKEALAMPIAIKISLIGGCLVFLVFRNKKDDSEGEIGTVSCRCLTATVNLTDFKS